jgi:PIN domain nuclease of toxin-antitoxin system
VSEAVLDSSAVLALLFAEPGAAAVEAVLPGALLSTVNFAEVVSKLREHGMPASQARAAIEAIGVDVEPFDSDQATIAGALRPTTRSIGLSLGDRACLALAQRRGFPALTTDQAWSRVDGANVVCIRAPK